MAFGDYENIIKSQGRSSGRPDHIEKLFFHAITDDPESSSVFYEDWDFEHAGSQRFFVGGLRWFFRRTGLNAESLHSYSDEASKLIRNHTSWTDIASVRGSDAQWDNVARQQFNRANAQKSLFLQKAANVIVSCELCAQDLLDNGKLKETAKADITSGGDIYKRMSIIPACWNVNDFNSSFLEEVEEHDPALLKKIARASGEGSTDILNDLAAGNTVTHQTAAAIEAEVTNGLPDQFSVGGTRARPGKKKLGLKRAAASERVSCG